jgi:16S rRNA (guanine966-N2)-methyltransferase
MEDANVADLFCGTGNLGIEALSREAKFCTFVEMNPKSLAIARQNFEKLKIPSSNYKVISMEVIAFLKSFKGEPFDIIFADPPFTEKMAHFVMEAASTSAAFGANTVLAIESQAKERMEDRYGQVVRYSKKEYGDKILSMFCHESAMEEDSAEGESGEE